MAFSIHALTPTAEQIEQFRALPQAQQEALARQYGIDMSLLTSPGSLTPSQADAQPTIQPRDTRIQQQRLGQTGLEREEEGLQPFGYDLFAGEPSSTVPLNDLPVPSDYIIGPGDEIFIQMFGKDNAQYALMVKRDGTIELPKLGPFHAAGMNFSQLKDSLSQEFSRKVIGVETNITMGKLRTMQIMVMGEAYKPDAYVLSSLATATQAIRAAGGFRDTGSLRNVQIRRAGKLVARLDLYKLLLTGDSSGDMRLQDGDTVFIAAKGPTIEVDGQVLRPAIYELKDDTAISDVMDIAGGLLASAYSQKISVERATNKGREVFTTDLTDPQGRRFQIKDGDKVTVPEISEQLVNAVSVKGSVVRPGAYRWQPGMRVSSLLHSTEGDLQADVDLNYALVIRQINAQKDIRVIQFNLGNAIDKPGSTDDILLEKDDQVLVFNSFSSLEEEQEQPEPTADQLQRQQQRAVPPVTGTSSGSMDMRAQAQFSDSQVGQAELAQSLEQSQLAKGLQVAELSKTAQSETAVQDQRIELLKSVIAKLRDQSSVDTPMQIAEIRGAVRFPGVYPINPSTRLNDLIVAAGGLKEAAYTVEGEVSRMMVTEDKTTIRHSRFNVGKALAGSQDNFLVASKDRINVFTKPEWREDYTVELEGEVRFPGIYTFQRGETLRDVIDRAGGLTDFAYPAGAIFSRESLRELEQQKLVYLHEQLRREIGTLAFRRRSSSNPLVQSSSTREAMNVVNELGVAEPVGRMVINLPEILSGVPEQNVMLENGDKLVIPPLRKVVSVVGQVQMSSSYIFDGSMTIQDYINSAGGPKKQADEDRIYVIRANGSVVLPNTSYWFSRKQVPLQPGDTVVVPMDTDYMDALSAWTSATQILYQLGVAWSAINN